MHPLYRPGTEKRLEKMQARARELVSRMTLDEKIGQLVQTNGIFFLKDDTELTGPASELEIDLDYRKNIGSLLNFKNATNAIKIQEKAEEMYPGLFRDINLSKSSFLYCSNKSTTY